MASARASTNIRRGGGQGDSTGLPDHETEKVSGARWAGVGLVLGSLVAAITLAVFSPTQPGGVAPVTGAAEVEPTATPTFAITDVRIPAEVPTIESIDSPFTTDATGKMTTSEREVDITVTLPPTELKPKFLTLQVLLGGSVAAEAKRARDEIPVKGIKLAEGPNTLEARLMGPGGAGPASEPISITLDTKPPAFKLRSPKDNAKTERDTITVAGDAEMGAVVTITNTATRSKTEETVGPTGTFDSVVPLDRGENEIRVTVADEAGNGTTNSRTVTRSGAGVSASLEVTPDTVKVGKLPQSVKISTRVTEDGDPVRGAQVTFTLSIPDQETVQQDAVTDGSGRAAWSPEIPKAEAVRGAGFVTISVRAPGRGKVERRVSAPTLE